jgi:hypothetical protein
MRAEYEAAEARGLVSKTSQTGRKAKEQTARERPAAQPRLKVVWNVCDQGGRVVGTFPYNQKAEAEAHAEALKARGKGKFFVRSDKVPME